MAETNLFGLWSQDSDPDLAGDTVTHISDTAHRAPQFPLKTNGESGCLAGSEGGVVPGKHLLSRPWTPSLVCLTAGV